MNKKSWALLFFIVLLLHVAAIGMGNRRIEDITKPLLMVVVAAYFMTATRQNTSPLKKWILSALFFSWAGDILLQFQGLDSMFFLLGLSSFLLAHIFYVVFLDRVKRTEAIRSNMWPLLAVAIFYAGLMVLLSPSLNEYKLPVRIYGLVISFMLMLALHMLYLPQRIAGRYIAAGALLFIVSDSVLAINKFYQPFNGAGIIIMLTYGLAQFLIVAGVSQYIANKNPPDFIPSA